MVLKRTELIQRFDTSVTLKPPVNYFEKICTKHSNNINMESLAFLKMVTGEGGMEGKSEEMGYCGRLDVIAEKLRRAKTGNVYFIRRASEHDSNSSTLLQNFTMPSTSSPPQRSSTTHPESISSPTFLTASSEADPSANDTLSHNDTANSTDAPGFLTEVGRPTVTTLAPTNKTNTPGNLTDSQDGTNLSAGDNQTSTTSDTTLSTNATTPLPKGEPKTSTSASPTASQTLSASTRPQITTSPSATTTQSRGKSSTVTTKGTSTPTTTANTITTTTTTTTTTQPTEFSSTTVLAKARVDTPSELNVGDSTENASTSMDPLLAGLVSMFVVSAAIVSLLIFLKFRHRNERPEFRRLQDLPMDDMMEDTPLSMYSY
ncbi:cell wall protein DAN4 isoform X1 [Tachysurus ichikawai]